MESHSKPTIEDQVREAIVTEITRQAELPDSSLKCEVGDNRLTVNGTIDLDALAFVIVASLAGAP